MKTILILVMLVGICTSASAANYYFSSQMGDDSRTPEEAKNPSTPWKTVQKLNAIFNTLQPGDSVLFKRGETFYGNLITSKSGSAAASIVIGAFGNGKKPILTGGVEVNEWTSLGGGIWESASAINTDGEKVNIVTVGAIPAQMGRHPNAGVNSKGITDGWLTITGHGKKQISDADSTQFSKTWLGAEVVLKPIRHIIDRGTITAINGNTISYTGGSYYAITDGNGYFFQNHPALLDKPGEWYFNEETKKLRIYTGNSRPAHVVVATINTIIDLQKKSFISFDNIEVSYGNTYGADITDAKNIKFTNCDFLFNMDAIYGLIPLRTTVDNCVFNYNLDDAIYLHRPSGTTPATMNVSTQHNITNNTITNTGTIAGMGRSGDSKYNALTIFGANNLIQYNTIKNTGYCPIAFYWGDNTAVLNNFIDSFSLVKNDAGGIYTWNNSSDRKGGSDTAIAYKGQCIEHNIILNGIGNTAGTGDKNSMAMGIYFDHRVSNVNVKNNTVYNCERGFFFLSSHSDTLMNNTFYGNRERQIDLNYDLETDHGYAMRPIRNMVVTNNIFFSSSPAQTLAMYRTITEESDIKNWGHFDNNYYAGPVQNDAVIKSIAHQFKGIKQLNNNHNFKGWKELAGKDAHSTFFTVDNSVNAERKKTIRFEYNATKGFKKVNLSSPYYDVKNNKYTDSIELPPYSSVVLLPAKK